MLGTERMGDVASMYAVSAWLRDEVAAAVADSAVAAMRVHDELPTIWDDDAADAALWQLELGVRHTRKLADGIERLARLIDDCAGALISSWPYMSQAEAAAEAGGLRREPGVVHIPLWEEHMPRGQEGEPDFFERRAEYDERRAAYSEVAVIIVEGLQKTEEHLKDVADELEENWRLNLYLAAGDFVNSETKVLAQRYEHRGGKVGTRAGFVSRATTAGAPIIAGVGVVYDIYHGMDHAKAIAKGAAGLVGAGAVAKAGVLALQRFGFTAGPGVGVFISIAGGWVASELAGAAYDLVVPETPREKLFRETLRPDPATSDRPGPQLPEQRIPNGPGAP